MNVEPSQMTIDKISKPSSKDFSASKEKKKKKKTKKRKISSSSADSDSSDSYHQHKKKHKKHKHKKEKKLKKQEKKIEEDAGKLNDNIDRLLVDRAKAMAPMTKEEWEKRQNVVRRVYDKETGRHRLIKGDGEVLEEIVSRDRHKEINRTATKGDGEYFQAQVASLNSRL